MKKEPAVILPADRPATLGIARSLGRRGIPVFGIDADPGAYGLASKYVRACPLPGGSDSEENRLEFLLDLGKKLGRSVLFPVRDDDVLLCSRQRKALMKFYSYVMPGEAAVVDLVTKDGLQRTAEACAIPSPRMFVPRNRRHLREAAAGMPFPVVLKPVFSPSWLRPEISALLRAHPLSNPPKVALCADAGELMRTYDKISAIDKRLIVQEVIPGADERLAYCCFCIGRNGEPLAVFAGRKMRVLPLGFGSATCVRSFYDPELEEISLKLLSGARYRGLGGVEFKKDSRDERYKLIEFNARFGLWDSLAGRCGIDIPYIAYCDALGVSVAPQRKYREGVIWVDLQRDLRAFLLRRKGRRMKLADWIGSLRGEREGAVFSRDDVKPALAAAREMLDRPRAMIKGFFRREAR